MASRDEGWDSDRGETLVEVLVAIMILGIAGVAILTGLQMSVMASDIHRQDTTGGAYVRSFAEAIQEYVADGHYVDCAGSDAYKVAPVMNQLDLSADAFTQDAAKSVSASGVAGAGCAGDTGVQQLTLHVSTDNRSDEQLTILLRKPYAPSVAP